jgi:hypothetical protein
MVDALRFTSISKFYADFQQNDRSVSSAWNKLSIEGRAKRYAFGKGFRSLSSICRTICG